MNIKEFEVLKKNPYDLTLSFELYEGSEFDKKAYKLMEENHSLFADCKLNKEVFKYNISNKMSLRKYLTLGMDRQTMVYIIGKLIEAEMFFNSHGINKQYLIYDSDLILVDKDDEEITFVPVPATNHGLLVKPFRAFIKEVVANAIYDDEENLDYVGRLLTYVNSHKEIYPRDIEELLNTIRKTKYVVAEDEASIVTNIMDTFVGKKVDTQVRQAAPAPVPVSEPINVPVNEVVEEKAVEEPVQMPAFEVPEPVSVVAEPEEHEEIAPLTIFDVIKEEAPAKKEEQIEFPELILPSVSVPEEEEEEVHEQVSQPQLKSQFKVKEDMAPAAKPEVLKSSMPKKEEPKMSVKPAASAVSIAAPVSVKKTPYLVRTKTQEIIAIDKDEFKIGKIAGMADYLLNDNPAVSRMHAIIHQIEGAYYVCDNYSTNATYLNGEKLEPGKNYLLINGVKISFANEAFTYLVG